MDRLKFCIYLAFLDLFNLERKTDFVAITGNHAQDCLHTFIEQEIRFHP